MQIWLPTLAMVLLAGCAGPRDTADDPLVDEDTETDSDTATPDDCDTGFVRDGETCVDIDDCVDAPCEHGGTCTDAVNGFTCECPPEYSGATCADDVDECALGTDTCAGLERCDNTDGAFMCVCDPDCGAGSVNSDCTGCVYPDADEDGYTADVDCDDQDPAVNPGAVEVCDGIDNDCMDGPDNWLGESTQYRDLDGDGYGDPDHPIFDCERDGYAYNDGDPDDTDPRIPAQCAARVRAPDALGQAYLDTHNDVRAGQVVTLEPAPEPALCDLAWDAELAAIAQSWADVLASNCVHQVNPGSTAAYGDGNQLVGETIDTYGSVTFTPFGPDDATEATERWANEATHYTYGPVGSGDCAPNYLCGNFTQLVWRDTTHIGCGSAVSLCGSFHRKVAVCNYFPAGNYWSEYPY